MRKLTILLLVWTYAAKAQICFNSPVQYLVDTVPAHIRTADFNNDGNLDLAIACYQASGNVAILLGLGNGMFGTTTYYSAGNTPRWVECCDVNNDGKTDLAIANNTSHGVSVFKGTGSGTFNSPSTAQTGTNTLGSPTAVTCADFNGDGKVDIAASMYYANAVEFLVGSGTGQFGLVNTFTVAQAPLSVIHDDFNLDGRQDLATANRIGCSVSLLFGDGTGNFPVRTDLPVGLYPNTVIAADFNKDGLPDLATSNSDYSPYHGNISILLNTGAGSFAPATTYSADSGSVSITSADFDLDGNLDLAVANMFAQNISLFVGNGAGSFTLVTSINLPGSPYGITSGDFDNDGKTDIAVCNADSVSILLNCTVMGIQAIDQSALISISPIPSGGSVIIKSQKDISSITITNTIGEAIYEDNHSRKVFEIRIAEPGAYFAFIRQQSVTKIQKILIAR